MQKKKIPYNPQIHAGEDIFVGRANLIDVIANGLEDCRSFGLVDGPGMGKTSFLYALQRELVNDKRIKETSVLPIPIYLDFKMASQFTKANQVLDKILEEANRVFKDLYDKKFPADNLKEWRTLIKQGQFPKALNRLLEWCFDNTKRNYRLVLLIDNIHRISQSVWFLEFASSVRPIVSLGSDLVLVLTGKRALETELRNDVSPLRELIAYQFSLGPLSEEETKELIQRAKKANMSIEDGCEIMVYEFTHGHPYKLHYYLYNLLQRYGEITRAHLKEFHQAPTTQRFINGVLEEENECHVAN